LSIYKVCSAGDIVLNRMSAYNGAVGLANMSGLVSPDYLVLRPTPDHDGRFLTRLIQSHWFVGEMTSRVRGIGSVDSGAVRTPRIGLGDLGEIRVAFPSRQAQAQIADYLDRETAQIDAFIAKNEELIALLTERRLAVITHHSTGNHPDSTVERFAYVARVRGGLLKPDDDRFDTLSLIAPNHIEPGTGRLKEFVPASQQSIESGKYFAKRGDVIYSKIRPALAKVTIAPEDCLCSADMYPVTSRNPNRLDNRFLFWQLLSKEFTEWATERSMRVAMPKVNQETLASAPIRVSPIQEQHRAIAAIEREIDGIDRASTTAHRAIELAKERRAALISAAVTGKIDVSREASAV